MEDLTRDLDRQIVSAKQHCRRMEKLIPNKDEVDKESSIDDDLETLGDKQLDNRVEHFQKQDHKVSDSKACGHMPAAGNDPYQNSNENLR